MGTNRSDRTWQCGANEVESPGKQVCYLSQEEEQAGA